VALPAWGNVDAGWLGVVCPGAGRGKGIVALPDVGDLVAVALPHADPAAGLVLGSLFGTLSPPDPGVDGAATRRFTVHTADGQSVVIDDAAHSLRLADRTGSFVELAPGAVRLHAKTDLVVEAPGHGLTIRAATVDFVQT
jgi:phage baseplate assembly protein gpV